MSRYPVQSKYSAGDIVYAKAYPAIGLVIRRYIDQVYYCKVQGDTECKEQVYFQRELMENRTIDAKNKRRQRWENEGGATQ